MKADQERVKNLLIDTVTLLCKNSLSYNDELCIEGLLGVKIDQKDVFFVHISQTFQNALTEPAVTEHAEQTHQTESHRESLNPRLVRVKREVLVEDHSGVHGDHGFPPRRDPGAVGAHRADVVAGQRRSSNSSHQRTRSSGGSPRGFSTAAPTNSSSPRGTCGDPQEVLITNNHHDQDPDNELLFGEPPAKRRLPGLKDEMLDNVEDDGSELTSDCTGDAISPWPNIGAPNAANLGLMATQMNHVVLRDFETTPSSDQPGCSNWPFSAGMLPQSSSDMNGSGSEGVAVVAERVAGDTLAWLGPSASCAGSPPPPASGPRRQFTCSTCAKVFTRTRDLVRHVRTHTGEKPYVCSYCQMAFALKGNWKTHVRRKHHILSPVLDSQEGGV